MALRIGVGFRLAGPLWIGYTVPLGRRLARHRGHFDPLGWLLGLVVLWAYIALAKAVLTGM